MEGYCGQRPMSETQKIYKKLGAQVRKLRMAQELTQVELGRRADKDPQHIWRLEHGRINPTVKYLSAIADALNVPLKRLFDFD